MRIRIEYDQDLDAYCVTYRDRRDEPDTVFSINRAYVALVQAAMAAMRTDGDYPSSLNLTIEDKTYADLEETPMRPERVPAASEFTPPMAVREQLADDGQTGGHYVECEPAPPVFVQDLPAEVLGPASNPLAHED
jgi:hypothetical protein